MKIESIISISFSEEEVRKALIEYLRSLMDTGSEEDLIKRKELVDHLDNTYVRVEVEDHNRFLLMADGIASSEEF